MQKYGKIRKLPRLPTKKIAEKFYTMPFCYINYAKLTRRTHFSHYPLWNEVFSFSIPFDGVWRIFMLSSHFATSKMRHYRKLFSTNFPLPSELSQKTSEFFQKTWEIFRKTLDIFQKTWEFFSAPSERRFLTANRNTKKAGNKGPTSLEVQPLIARIDNFQAWTNNYNITRARRKFTQQRRR